MRIYVDWIVVSENKYYFLITIKQYKKIKPGKCYVTS